MNEERVTVRRTGETVDTPAATTSVVEERVSRSPSGAEVLRRIVVFVFGMIQLVIGLRVILLILDADRANGVVATIYNLSAPLVAPFDGVLRTDAIHASGSVLDVAALVALVSWTILELVIVAAIGIARSREA